MTSHPLSKEPSSEWSDIPCQLTICHIVLMFTQRPDTTNFVVIVVVVLYYRLSNLYMLNFYASSVVILYMVKRGNL